MGHSDYPDWTSLVHLVGTDITLGIEVAAQTVDLDVNFIGSEIMVPMDLQGAYIMMPVDIQAQYVTIDINIKSQTANVDINLAASAITLSVNLQSSSITLNVNLQSSSITLNINIANMTKSYLNMHITGSITLNVNLYSSSITLDINIKSSDITLNVNLTSQSVNINIDIEAQSVGVYLEGEWETKEGNDKSAIYTASNKDRGFYAGGDYTVTAGKTLYVTHVSAYGYSYAAADGDKDQVIQAYLYNNTDGVYIWAQGGHAGCGQAWTKAMKLTSGKVLRARVFNDGNHAMNLGIMWAGYEI